jgi:hydrogenase maturation protein HypF
VSSPLPRASGNAPPTEITHGPKDGVLEHRGDGTPPPQSHPAPAAPSASHAAATAATVEISVRGVVQGVGFRPFVHRLALRHRLDGWVRNEAGAVRIVAQGRPIDVDSFVEAMTSEVPSLARIDDLEVVPTDPLPLEGFRIIASDLSPVGRLPVSPDVALCESCEQELFDPANRRHRYPFITCTDCGPRFTVIEDMPYDRERSTMRAFAQCRECSREYGDPRDRRYHSETNSCPACGPSVWLEGPDTDRRDAAGMTRGQAALKEAGRLLAAGGIVAVRGLGGFHLAVDATEEGAVRRLRARKRRDSKPLALMVRSLEDANRLALISEAEAAALASRERPIVVLRSLPGTRVASAVAPGLDTVGIMLAYTPLHHLLLEAAGGRPLVMTSGNVSDEPIAIHNEEAKRRLADIADAFLLHDREIVARYDDSLLRVVDRRPVFMRRARGYAPLPVPLPVPTPHPLLAVGSHLKNTFTLAFADEAYVSQHIGDLENLETLEHFADARSRFARLFRIEPSRVVRDLHPGYLSTRVAQESGLPELEPVQHHHAHVAAVMGEHGVTDQVLGLAFDGTGYGVDGRVWGCEFLQADLIGYRRLAHLRYVPLPGGDRAVRSPWRSLVGYVSLDGAGAAWAAPALAWVPPRELRVARRQISRGLNAPLASSMGRLFDAAAAVLGLRTVCRHEGQAAMELEAEAGERTAEALPFPLSDQAAAVPVLDPVPLLKSLARELARGAPVGELAARFHESIVSSVTGLTLQLCGRHGLERVALGGGCFQNARLLSGVASRLGAAGVDVLLPARLGPNDGAVSYGQAVIAAARSSS